MHPKWCMIINILKVLIKIFEKYYLATFKHQTKMMHSTMNVRKCNANYDGRSPSQSAFGKVIASLQLLLEAPVDIVHSQCPETRLGQHMCTGWTNLKFF